MAVLNIDDVMPRFESSLETYSVKIGGRWTTVRLEAELMVALREVALAEGTEIAEICTRLSRQRKQGSLTSALRLYILKHYRDRAGPALLRTPSSELAKELEAFRKSLLATEERDFVLRHDLDLDRLGDADPGVGFIYSYWKALCKAGNQPLYDDFSLDTLRSIGFDDNVHLIDVEADNPDEFRLMRMAPITRIYRATDNVPLKTLGETLYAREIKADYSAAKFKSRPTLQQISVRTREGALKYDRIILPCAVGEGRTGRLVVGVAPPSRLVPRRTSTRA